MLERSYPRDPPKVEPPQFNKEMVYENNCHVFEQVGITIFVTQLCQTLLQVQTPQHIFYLISFRKTFIEIGYWRICIDCILSHLYNNTND